MKIRGAGGYALIVIGIVVAWFAVVWVYDSATKSAPAVTAEDQ